MKKVNCSSCNNNDYEERSTTTNDSLQDKVHHHLDKIENLLETYCCKGTIDGTTIPFLIDCNDFTACFPPPSTFDQQDGIQQNVDNDNTTNEKDKEINWNNKYKDVELFIPALVVNTSNTKSIDDTMNKLDDIEKQQIYYYAKRIHRNDIYSSHYKPTKKEKDELNHIYSLFKSKKNNSLVDDIHNSNEILLKQGSIIVTKGKKPISDAVVNNDNDSTSTINSKSNSKNTYHLLLYTKSIIIASYSYEGTVNTNNEDYRFKVKYLLDTKDIKLIVDLGLQKYDDISLSSKKITNSISKWFSSSPSKKKKEKRIGNDNKNDVSFDSSTSLESSSIASSQYNNDDYYDSSFLIQLKSGTYYSFTCTSPLHKTLWLDALYHMISKSTTTIQDQDDVHKKLQSNIYSASYIGDICMLQRTIIFYYNQNENDNSVMQSMLNTKDNYGCTPLHYAVKQKHISIVKYLLDLGVDPNVTNNDGYTPVDYAVQMSNQQKNENENRLLQMLIADGGIARTATNNNNSNQINKNIMQMNKRKSMLNDMTRKASDLNASALEYKCLSSTLAQEVKNKYK